MSGIAAAITTGAIISAAGSGIGAWFNYIGLKKQIAENQRAERVSIGREDRAIARSEQHIGEQLKLQKKQLGMQETQMNWDHATATRAKMMNWIASNNQRANNMISIWRGRK